MDSAHGLPMESSVDLSLYRTEGSKMAQASRIAVLKEYREKGMGRILFESLINYALSKKLTDLYATASTDEKKMKFYRSLGWYEIGNPFFCEPFNDHIVPIRLELDKINLSAFISQNIEKNKLYKKGK